jgi:hypothetical protein
MRVSTITPQKWQSHNLPMVSSQAFQTSFLMSGRVVKTCFYQQKAEGPQFPTKTTYIDFITQTSTGDVQKGFTLFF